MAQYPRYLLYIKEPRFADEPKGKRSGLVTRLLKEHYDKLENGHTNSVQGVVKKVKKIASTCEHGAGKGFCKVKGCEYAHR